MESTPAARMALIERLLPLARAAGEIILGIYAGEFAVRGKADASPVTEVDAAGRVPQIGRTFWLVDPLDGLVVVSSRSHDTAAGHAVLLAAGGRVTDLAGRDLGYGKPGFANPHFVATGV